MEIFINHLQKLTHSINLLYSSFCVVYVADGGWSEWKEISGCSATCGEGIIKVQIRSCSEPPSSCGGKYCEGPDLQFVPCNVPACCPGLLLKCIITSKIILNPSTVV